MREGRKGKKEGWREEERKEGRERRGQREPDFPTYLKISTNIKEEKGTL